MTGVSMEVSWDGAVFADALVRLETFPGDRAPAMFDAIGTAMVASTQARFLLTQDAPDGTPWKPSKRFLRDGAPPTLTEHGYLERSQTHNVTEDGVEWGSALAYAAIHQAGGTIHREPHEQTTYRKLNKDGTRGAKFVRAKDATLEETFHLAAYDIHMPARPYLGISAEDEVTIEDIATRHLQAALLGVSPGASA